MTAQDRIAGCLLGGAIGDALGNAFEGKPAPVVLDPAARLRISDDTQLTLATCEAITATGKVEADAIAAQFVRWFKNGEITGVGSSTLKALRDLQAGGHWALVGVLGERAAGNGAAMRIAPLVFLVDPTTPQGRMLIRDVSSITHRNDAAYVGALAIALAIWFSASDAKSCEMLPGAVAEHLPDSLVRDRLLKLADVPAAMEPVELAAEVGNSGFVAESVPLAIHAARNTLGGFYAAICRAIEAGGDTDTIGSMTGQIVGARLGRQNVPVGLLEKCSERDTIVRIVDRFSTAVAVTA